MYNIICSQELFVGMTDNQSSVISDVYSQSAFSCLRKNRKVRGGPTAVLRDIDSSPSNIPLCPLGHRDGELQSYHEGCLGSDKKRGLRCSQIEGVRCGYCEYIRLMRANVRRFKKMGIRIFTFFYKHNRVLHFLARRISTRCFSAYSIPRIGKLSADSIMSLPSAHKQIT